MQPSNDNTGSPAAPAFDPSAALVAALDRAGARFKNDFAKADLLLVVGPMIAADNELKVQGAAEVVLKSDRYAHYFADRGTASKPGTTPQPQAPAAPVADQQAAYLAGLGERYTAGRRSSLAGVYPTS